MSEQARQVHETEGQGSQMLLLAKNLSHQTSLYGLQFDQKKRLRGNKSVERPTWIEKGKVKSLILLTSLKAGIEKKVVL